MVAASIVGRDANGDMFPGWLTNKELVTEIRTVDEIRTAAVTRLADLLREAKTRTKQPGYPSFPADVAALIPRD